MNPVNPLLDQRTLEVFTDRTLAAELRARGAVVILPGYYNHATGLVRQEDTWIDPISFAEVDGAVAYDRARGGW